jgi:PAS domain S-box-containing protein
MLRFAVSAATVVVAFVVVYLLAVARRARRAAETLMARQRDLIELAPDAFFLADLDGRLVDVNQCACRMLGYEREELLAKTVADILHPEDMPRLAMVRAALLSPGKANTGEWRHRRKDGTVVTVEVSSNILPGGRWQAFARDITERKRAVAERKRIEDEQRFLAEAGALLATSLDYEQTLTTLGQLMVRDFADWCIVDVVEDAHRAKRVKVVSARPDPARLGAALEQLRIDRRLPHLARPVLETRRPYLMERVTPETIASFAQSEEHLHVLRTIDPQSIMGLPLAIRGQLIGVLILVSATPARTYGPDDLRLADAVAELAAFAIEHGRLYETALRATQLRDEVLGVVAHDLRNPAATIIMQATAMKRRGGEPERRNQKPVESILRTARRMNRLIDDLLDVTLIEAGQLRINYARVATRQLILDAVEPQRTLASSGAIDLKLQLADELPDVRGDQHRLTQVLENLIGNAIKFTPIEGRITIGAASRDSEVLFWVADTGSGIAPDGLPHVFDRFWQAVKGAHHGVGLGLPVARGIVEAHGGRIWVESILGRGTIFFFTVPAALTAAAQPSETETETETEAEAVH